MLCANVATARFMQDHDIPSLYRVHDGPPAERLDKLRLFLGELGLTLNRGKGEPTPATTRPCWKPSVGARTTT